MDSILEYIGALSVGIVFIFSGFYFIFKVFIRKWVENRFDRKLKEIEHEQALEIQKIGIKIDAIVSRTLKIQEKEFEVLPEAWSLFYEAYGRVKAFVARIQSYPDLNAMTKPQLDEFLDSSNLLETQKKTIEESANKVASYAEAIFWHELGEVRETCRNFHMYISRYAIFFPVTLKQKLLEASDGLWDSFRTRELGQEMRDNKTRGDAFEKFEELVEPLYGEIETEIQTYLHAHVKVEV